MYIWFDGIRNVALHIKTNFHTNTIFFQSEHHIHLLDFLRLHFSKVVYFDAFEIFYDITYAFP